jgi:selenocysteine-specific elongation factor
VLTGTLVDGSLALEDRVVVFPDGIEARIRSIQSHERTLDSIDPGNRTALNVAGIDRHEVRRGAMVGLPGEWSPTTRFTAELMAVRSLGEPIRERGAFRLHAGSGSWSARLRLLDTDAIDQRGLVLIETGTPIPVRWGDRIIVREVGRRAVVGGGRVLDPAPPRRGRDARAAAEALREATEPDQAAGLMLAVRGAVAGSDLAAATGGGVATVAIEVGRMLMAPSRVAHLLEQAVTAVDAFHEANPLRPGIPKARLAAELDLTPDALESLLPHSTEIEMVGADVARAGFGVDLDPSQQTAWERAAALLDQAGFAPPAKQDLGLAVELEHALVRRGDLVAVSDELLYRRATLDEMVAITADLPDGFTVADFRDAVGITRKHAIPLVEWMDRTGVTIRGGDGRRVRGKQD